MENEEEKEETRKLSPSEKSSNFMDEQDEFMFDPEMGDYFPKKDIKEKPDSS